MSYAYASNGTRLKFCCLIQGYGSLIYLYCFSHQIVRDDHDKLEEQKKWLDTEVEKVVQQRKEMEFLQEVGALVFYCSPNRSPHIYRSTYLLLPNPFPNKPWFLFVCSTSLLKTLREKEKLFIASDFSLSQQCFSTHLENFLPLHQI